MSAGECRTCAHPEMSRPVFIYGLYEDDELRYIGQSVDPKARLLTHQSEARAGATSPRCLWVRSLQDAGKAVRLVVLAETDESAADDLERDFIARHAASGRLVNAVAGGGGAQRGPLKVRRTAWIDVALDREVCQLMAREQKSYSSTVEAALRDYLALEVAS